MEVLRGLHRAGYSIPDDCCAMAAANGQLAVLKWACEIGCDRNENTCYSAAVNGHLEVLKWSRENGFKWNPQECLYYSKDEAIKKWILANFSS